MSTDIKNLSKSVFIEKYGHLRPGTYDILTKSYSEDPDKYFNDSHSSQEVEDKREFSLTLDKLNLIDKKLKELGIEHTSISLFNFLKTAIEGREYSKFLFTKNLSESMILIREVSKRFGFTRDDLSYMNIDIIKNLYTSTNKFSSTISWSISMGKKVYNKVTTNLTLPPLLIKPEDAECFLLEQNDPNYITLKKVESKVVFHHNKNDLEGNILLIPSADPGFDWIFTHNIAGFITMYGGSNSHMAIRAAELNIPAVIGAGEVLYNKWAKAKMVSIDCSNKKVNILQ